MKTISILGKEYVVMKDVKEAIDLEALEAKMTDYFEAFDYIVGDWSYGKLRLKGFNSKTNANFKSFNDIDQVDNYIRDYCAYGCRYFILGREK